MVDIQAIKKRYGVIGNTEALNRAIEIAVQVAPTDMRVLITGESGVGKDIFSKIIHDNSLRSRKSGTKLITVNCGAIPEGTMESELFGHVKGAFTGADRDRKGYFETADKGTIFLDEIGDLPKNIQVKLLRVLENGEIIRMGASEPQKVDVRVVAATNVDLLAAVRDGKFREDLYFRLCQMQIHIPPLRERKEDIYPLFHWFATEISKGKGMKTITLDDEAKAFLTNYPWYGNIRELRSFTEKISYIEPERFITKTILQKYIEPTNLIPIISPKQQDTAISDRELLLQVLSMGKMIHELHKEVNALKETITTLAQGGMPIYQPIDNHQNTPAPIIHRPQEQPIEPIEDDDFIDTEAEAVEEESLSLIEREKNAIQKALTKHHGNRRLAAEELKISDRTLYRKIKGYNL